jgi:hypothetical protein
MEFKITKAAKNTILYVVLTGLLLLIIGLISGYNDPHFVTRLLTNGLINGFFFFALGLGALFFLALNYATESGWYASVK